MGASASTPSNNSSHPPTRALHVLRVTPGSPAAYTDIEAFFDFLVGIEGDALSSNMDASALERVVESHEGRTLSLLVWSSKTRSTRLVPITPSRAWSQPDPSQSSTNAQPSLLGLSMRICEPEFALDNVWHILEVLEGSPAESAGLVPYGDWIVGWSGGVLSSEGDFYDVVEAHVDKPLRVYVYSYDFDTLREVVLVPNRQWGGDGLLGCGVGFGLLHRIPPPSEDRTSVDKLLRQHEEEERQKKELFVPADDHTSDFGWSSHGINPHDDGHHGHSHGGHDHTHEFGHNHAHASEEHSHDHSHSHSHAEHNHHHNANRSPSPQHHRSSSDLFTPQRPVIPSHSSFASSFPSHLRNVSIGGDLDISPVRARDGGLAVSDRNATPRRILSPPINGTGNGIRLSEDNDSVGSSEMDGRGTGGSITSVD